MLQSVVLGGQANKTSTSKIDCAKECPCGVPVIPVPDQWLEVMVSGGFKVWHIIFIIISFIITIIVVYCCFHRCRIPRTKQEIEADLMRTNITNKFRDHLRDFPNEPTTFLEALKRVQELEEKLESEDAKFARDSGARKRMGWLKLKGSPGGGALNPADQTSASGEKTKPAAAVAPAGENGPTGSGSLPAVKAGDEAVPAGALGAPARPVPASQGAAVAAAPSREARSATAKRPRAPDRTREPGKQLATLPKSVEAARTGPQEPGKGAAAQGQTRPPRRPKQKPNLSRTKQTREVEPPAGPPDGLSEASGLYDANGAARSGPPVMRQHVHRVRIEQKPAV